MKKKWTAKLLDLNEVGSLKTILTQNETIKELEKAFQRIFLCFDEKSFSLMELWKFDDIF